MLYLFGLDGTLISGYMDTPDKNYHNWDVLPGRREKLAALQEAGHTVRIITNQGGVAFGFISEADMWQKLGGALIHLGLNPVRRHEDWGRELAYVCFHDVRGIPPYNDPDEAKRRKPSGAMIREAMRDYPDAAASGVLYVGDRQEDHDAARDAGVSFQWAHVFFTNT